MEEEKKDERELIADEDIENPSSALKKLRDALAECRRAKDEYLAGWQRAKADFINAERGREKDIMYLSRVKELAVLREFLEIVDNFEKALKDSVPDTPWKQGIQRIYSQALALLERHNMRAIETSGKRFDPLYHEAIEMVELPDETNDGIVVEEIQKGYLVGEDIVRPAKVKVGIHNKKL